MGLAQRHSDFAEWERDGYPFFCDRCGENFQIANAVRVTKTLWYIYGGWNVWVDGSFCPPCSEVVAREVANYRPNSGFCAASRHWFVRAA